VTCYLLLETHNECKYNVAAEEGGYVGIGGGTENLAFDEGPTPLLFIPAINTNPRQASRHIHGG
jgi:hypothetical protein